MTIYCNLEGVYSPSFSLYFRALMQSNLPTPPRNSPVACWSQRRAHSSEQTSSSLDVLDAWQERRLFSWGSPPHAHGASGVSCRRNAEACECRTPLTVMTLETCPAISCRIFNQVYLIIWTFPFVMIPVFSST